MNLSNNWLRETMNQHHIEIKALVLFSYEEEYQKDYEKRLGLLEKAHLISQIYALEHLMVHWHMFLLAIEFRNTQEFLGQIPRLLLAMPGSWFGRAPKGNIGSTKMGIFEER